MVAHRGSSFDVAEHTLAAYKAAIDGGADALECDVRMTRDGHLVCVHDRTVNRTSDGRGAVSSMDLKRLESLDFASWRTDAYLADVAPDEDNHGRVLTLDALLTLVRDAPRPVRLLIETKHPTRYGGLVEIEVVKALHRFGWAGELGDLNGEPSRPRPFDQDRAKAAPVTVMSFAPLALRRIRLLAPDLPTVLLSERLLPGRRDGSLPVGVPISGPGLHILRSNPGYVDRAHARGSFVYVWTVDEPDDIDYVLHLGVDAVISNRPDLVLSRLAQVK
ncbi:glycerophosphoryl diester phosphodiesterase [Jatrophihabitans sp. GAS493]|uniref:glycerophosphodiester phosphodiesterase n=1 Tax=Jatrophihabitans sp. GAS493 TaxID=1907575 RepID=UPI000BC080AD|nr:glycerophosphodiester phosphodiesterase family protein [Jatrophihabitans sp. GAS493]SOD71060.1 glycerophosphoryl diester phosphodiesterase [Jatrophihabitans sp. GAS493]